MTEIDQLMLAGVIVLLAGVTALDGWLKERRLERLEQKEKAKKLAPPSSWGDERDSIP